MNKTQVIEAVTRQLSSELEAVMLSAKAAHEAATHEESRAEDAHDTRGLEASYLAGAQAARVAELQRLVTIYKHLDVPGAQPASGIASGSLVELDSNGRRSWYLLVHQGGGATVQVEGRRVQVITPQAPLGEALLGRRLGETVEVEIQNGIREYEIMAIL